MGKVFIKIMDEKVALALAEGGFSYIEEIINGGRKIFVFEKSIAVETALREIIPKRAEAAKMIEEDVLRF